MRDERAEIDFFVSFLYNDIWRKQDRRSRPCESMGEESPGFIGQDAG